MERGIETHRNIGNIEILLPVFTNLVGWRINEKTIFLCFYVFQKKLNNARLEKSYRFGIGIQLGFDADGQSKLIADVSE